MSDDLQDDSDTDVDEPPTSGRRGGAAADDDEKSLAGLDGKERHKRQLELKNKIPKHIHLRRRLRQERQMRINAATRFPPRPPLPRDLSGGAEDRGVTWMNDTNSELAPPSFSYITSSRAAANTTLIQPRNFQEWVRAARHTRHATALLLAISCIGVHYRAANVKQAIAHQLHPQDVHALPIPMHAVCYLVHILSSSLTHCYCYLFNNRN